MATEAVTAARLARRRCRMAAMGSETGSDLCTSPGWATCFGGLTTRARDWGGGGWRWAWPLGEWTSGALRRLRWGAREE